LIENYAVKFNLRFQQGKPFDVVGLGLNSVDFLCVIPKFPALNTKTEILHYTKGGGGQVATAMVACSKWGLRTKYVGKVGGDDLGLFSLKSIREAGVDVSSVTIERDSANQFAFILIDAESGERTIIWHRDKELLYREGQLSREDIRQGTILHVDGHDIDATIKAIKWAQEDGIFTVIDIDKVEEKTPELIRDVDFLVTSATFGQKLTGIEDRERALLALKRYNRGFLCATLGREGAMAVIGNRIVYSKGFEVEAVDTTGAGDVFHAGFLYGLIKNWEVGEILRFANAVAALKCTRMGGRSVPTLEEVNSLLGVSSQTHA
jgi:sugar/nucleoside kinase (ribokinase family)